MTVHTFTTEELAIRDTETTRRALELAAEAAYKWWDGEPEDALELRTAILALRPAPTGWRLVPEDMIQAIGNLTRPSQFRSLGESRINSDLVYELVKAMIGSVK